MTAPFRPPDSQPGGPLSWGKVTPFLDAVEHFVGRNLRFQTLVSDFNVVLDAKPDPPLVSLRFTLTLPGLEPVHCFPEPPLSFNAVLNDAAPTFVSDLEAIVLSSAHTSIPRFLQARGHQREQLLYAANEGLRKVSVDFPRAFRQYSRTVFRNLTLLAMIDPHAEQQLFVQLCLTAFIKVLDTLRSRSQTSSPPAAISV